MRKKLVWAFLLVQLVASVWVEAGTQAAAAADPWQWLSNTYWYVPTKYLLAIASSPSLPSPIPVSDQTVYHIQHYQGGYFWGTTAVSYTAQQSSEETTPSCLQLVGSVTPEGKLHSTFTPLPSAQVASPTPTPSSDSTSEPTVGIGTMVLQRGAWTMENQMSTIATGSLLLTHWAYMYQCKPDEPCFSALPGVGTSIPNFLGSCLAPPG
jgi:hypothetical protein